MPAKEFLIFLSTICLIQAFPNPNELSLFSSKFDNLDVTRVLSSDRLLTKYVDCLMDKGSCTSEARELKENLPEAIETDCARCTEKQKQKGFEVVDFLRENKPDVWAVLKEKFDPGDKYETRLKERNNSTIEPTVPATKLPDTN